MKRKADLISTNSVEAEVNCESKKLAIELYEPPVAATPLDHVKKMKRKARKPREKIDDGPKPSPVIPTRLKDMIEKMGGTEWRLIIQKGLRPTDLSRNHGRLSMPSTEWDLLSPEELVMFENGNNVRVPMIDTKMKVWECASVRRWKMKKTMFVIADVWNKLAAENELKVKDVVQIWCFKFIQTGRHGLAMVKIGAASTHISSIGSSTSIVSSTASNTRIVTESDAIGSGRTRHEVLSTQVAITESALPNTSSDEIDFTLRLNNTHIISSCAARTPQVPTPNDHSCKVAEASSSTAHSHIHNSADNNGSGNYREGLVTYLNYLPTVPDSIARHGGLSVQVAITESALPNTSSDEIDLTLRL